MIAITLLFAKGVIEHHAVLEDGSYRRWLMGWSDWAGNAGIVLLWVAGGLTILTGWDYFRKALPFLRETAHD